MLTQSLARFKQGATAARRTLKRLVHDRQGVGGVEFAIVAPMLIVIYLMAFELTMGLSVAKKTSMASSTIADLVARQENVNKTFLATMSDVTGAIFVPYASNNLLINVARSGSTPPIGQGRLVLVHHGACTLCGWQRCAGPADMLVADTFLIRSELSVTHELMMYCRA